MAANSGTAGASRLVVAVFAMLLALPSAARGQTGGGFHGYGWGTAPESIPLLAGDQPAEVFSDGREVYHAGVRFLGMPTRAVFTFAPDSGGLVAGRYLSEPEGLSCVAQFRTLHLMAAGASPTADVEVGAGTGDGGETLREACRRFLAADSAREWTAEVRDPGSGDVAARIRLIRDGGTARLVACYGAMEDCRWPPGVSVQEGPVMAPAGRDTAAGQRE